MHRFSEVEMIVVNSPREKNFEFSEQELKDVLEGSLEISLVVFKKFWVLMDFREPSYGVPNVIKTIKKIHMTQAEAGIR